MKSPTKTEFENIYEVRFKNTRKAFFKNVNGLPLITGDFVVLESDRGYDVGQISLGGILAELQMKKRKINKNSDRVRKIYRMASQEDLEKLQLARSREQETLVRSREIIRELNLDMKMSDVEFQGDNTKAIFYYIADTRVDFRQLIKFLANEFRIRVEMKQIGLRHESGLVGGIGSCGRELCCSTWLTDFKSVSTSAARYQNLSLNPMKISGQCGRLKCCLNFELDSYLDALEDIPKVDRIDTEAGMAVFQKVDIFKRTMWFSYEKETTWIPVHVDLVKQMVALNKDGQKPASIKHLSKEDVLADIPESIDFVDVVGQAVLREDPRKSRKKKKKGRGRSDSGPQNKRRDQNARKDNSEKGSRDKPKSRGRDGDSGGRPDNKNDRRGGGRGRGKNQGGNRRNSPNNRNRNGGSSADSGNKQPPAQEEQ